MKPDAPSGGLGDCRNITCINRTHHRPAMQSNQPVTKLPRRRQPRTSSKSRDVALPGAARLGDLTLSHRRLKLPDQVLPIHHSILSANALTVQAPLH